MSFLEQIQGFSKTKLKPTSTNVTTPDGRQLVESRDESGRVRVKLAPGSSLGYVGDYKPDLQVGEILPGLIMGSQDVAADIDLLKKHGVTHILNVATMVENFYPSVFTYKRIQMLDLPETDITSYFDECFEFIDHARHSGCVLVHCSAGVSRAASITIGYMMKTRSMDYKQAYDYVKSKRPSICPNAGFRWQLKAYKPQS